MPVCSYNRTPDPERHKVSHTYEAAKCFWLASDGACIYINCDSAQLVRVMLNLMEAMRHTDPMVWEWLTDYFRGGPNGLRSKN